MESETSSLSDPIDSRLGHRLKHLRQMQRLTLDGLAERAGVSRAMISRIERGEASPTAQLLNRLCAALDTTLSRFFAQEDGAGDPLSRREAQRLWRDPATGYLRRSVSPERTGSPVDIIEVEFPAHGRVVFDPHVFDGGTTQHVWVLQGAMRLTSGDVTCDLQAGDCLFMRLDDGQIFENPHAEPARYAVILHRREG
ncbi:DNA-binding protein [Xaviernesmea oryzae]|uniref:DNA-binding protein n=1 Tax=Xaviernesmea oryzae TaxID=464029 RepID=A0A1Q9AUF8_9HYPH|nr:helix-turn-helix domain-containing protein [Xaviernesmea oryzae]OLP59089.1 DNA-binding protein [Xaviernesmea oryzae]SEK87241.1 Transcriptional regulator, contains XRE-family HTH domain [Xaviernesmea oryzae]